MNKIAVTIGIGLVAIVMQPATMAATYPTKEVKPIARSTSHKNGSIRVFTYLVGGPHRKANQRQPVNNVVVRVRRAGDSRKLVREVKFLRNGRVIFWVSPGTYQVEGTIEPSKSAVTVRRPCGSKIVRVHKNRQALVRLYCSIP